MCFCHFSHIKYKYIQKNGKRILLARAWYFWALLKSTDTLFIGQTWSNAEVAKSTCKQKSQEMQNEQVQIHWRSWWSQSTSCRQKKPALFPYTGHSHQNSRQWDRTCSPDNFVHAFCYSSFKLLSQENQNHTIHLKWIAFGSLCFSLRSAIPPNLRAGLELNVPSIVLHARTCTCFIVL